MPDKQHNSRKRGLGFNHALRGIRQVVTHETNFRIHLFATIAVVVLGFVLEVTATEWLIICMAIGMVMGAELFNSAIEKLVDIVHPNWAPKAGLIKDISAGAVLVAAFAAAVAGLLIFIPKLIVLL